tara:strand:+ start:966 stop:1190 length:225 start_codon:yes stop_codon:yes gene_type:complete
MSKIYHFRGGNQELKTYSKKTFEALQQVKAERIVRVSIGLRERVVKSMRALVKGSANMKDDQVLIAYLDKVLKA